MADKNKFVKPELKKYSAKKLLTQDRLMNCHDRYQRNSDKAMGNDAG